MLESMRSRLRPKRKRMKEKEGRQRPKAEDNKNSRKMYRVLALTTGSVGLTLMSDQRATTSKTKTSTDSQQKLKSQITIKGGWTFSISGIARSQTSTSTNLATRPLKSISKLNQNQNSKKTTSL